MDFIMEFVLELLFEAPFEAAMESRKIKTAVKTALFSLLGGVIVLFFGFMTYEVSKDGELWRTAAMAVMTGAMLALVIWGAVHGHKKKWKN